MWQWRLGRRDDPCKYERDVQKEEREREIYKGRKRREMQINGFGKKISLGDESKR